MKSDSGTTRGSPEAGKTRFLFLHIVNIPVSSPSSKTRHGSRDFH